MTRSRSVAVELGFNDASRRGCRATSQKVTSQGDFPAPSAGAARRAAVGQPRPKMGAANLGDCAGLAGKIARILQAKHDEAG